MIVPRYWCVPIHDFSKEQYEIIKRVYGTKECHYLVSNGCKTFTHDNDLRSKIITPDEAFEILGLAKVTETKTTTDVIMKLDHIDWSKVPELDVYVVQDLIHGDVYSCSQDWFNKHKKRLIVIAKRPKPPLTDEQIAAVREFCKWSYYYKDTADTRIDEWLKQRGGEHE